MENDDGDGDGDGDDDDDGVIVDAVRTADDF